MGGACVPQAVLGILPGTRPGLRGVHEAIWRSHFIFQTLLTRRFMEAKNEERPTVAVMLTALFHNWEGGPYSSSHHYGLHVFEYSDHSS